MDETSETIRYEIRSRNLAYALERAALARRVRNYGHERLMTTVVSGQASASSEERVWLVVLVYRAVDLPIKGAVVKDYNVSAPEATHE